MCKHTMYAISLNFEGEGINLSRDIKDIKKKQLKNRYWITKHNIVSFD